ncbi:MAG: hypothetical protein QOE10_1879, partial [Gaiellales bacterium]|nr:hypothetical protein [Gaiellales bacterium]
MRAELRAPLVQRGAIFAGFAALGAWHLARLQSPALRVGDLVLPLVLAIAVAAAARRRLHVLMAAALAWLVAVAAIAGRTAPSRAHPLATFSSALDRLREGGGRFSTIVLPFDPSAEPGAHALVVVAAAFWLVALALSWLVAARPLPAIVLGTLPVALVSTEFPLPRPGLRVALLVAFALPALASGRRVAAPAVAALALPLVLVALVAGSI